MSIQEGIRMLRYIKTTVRAGKDRGASAVEYGLMVAAIAAVIVGIVFGLGTVVKNQFDNTSKCITNKGVTGAGCTP